MRKLPYLLPYLLPLLLAFLLAGCGKQESDLPVNTRLGGEFTLTDQNGEPFSQAALNGKVTILFFGYTHCPDICPAVLARVAQVYRQLQEAGEADQVQPVFITFDPERDTAAHLKEYLTWFKANIIGLTGSLEEIRQVAKQYGVVFIKDQQEQDYLFTHSDYIYLLDDQGRVRKLYPADFTIDEVVNDAKSLL
ncbi:photosynthetic protein synthase I [Alcanivorax sp. HI0033]|uniref:SCO family protein n=1 Tax=unclassified Alcanivorax TaxID=2638842 RepID=UPI0007B82C16|nr:MULTISPECIES: SCO family protein [unclassified Alcanivorax]KZX73826.1 photosynthetic protein synthase I [Alcanivorax sp. HI0011]KZX78138.1 photosynthetic protein synthase I [Alcanivorax sp. HI0013]KZY13984.1 photosynthetic protein synthase I [Alcanivorax sp. HI0035]KZX62264.1 photosynthetic protein synthase I [Alcanivorax sp. HI0003]KZX71929.1 photosynthetic protein synthase I [Alcanivorax sp. HI0007]